MLASPSASREAPAGGRTGAAAAVGQRQGEKSPLMPIGLYGHGALSYILTEPKGPQGCWEGGASGTS